MAINLKKTEATELKPRIMVFGVGGAGGNAVNNMMQAKLEGVEFVVANTDAQALAQSRAERKIQMGAALTQGLGAGSQPDVGRAAAEEAMEEILEHLAGSHMVFITAGMGGGTGTGAAPVIARAAIERGILTVGVVTKPFQFEGAHRLRVAEAGIEELQRYVDTLLVIPNQNLFRIANERTTFAEAFAMADQVLHSGVRGITDLMVMPGLINLDFADVRTVMSEMGKAMMGTGEASGERRAIDAAEAAIANPLLDDVSMRGAKGVLINITGGFDLTLFELDEAANRIRAEVDPDANIIVGSTFNEAMEGVMRVSIVATGIEADETAVQRTSAKASTHAVGRSRPAAAAEPATEVPSEAENAPEFTEVTPPRAAESPVLEASADMPAALLEGEEDDGFEAKIVASPTPSEARPRTADEEMARWPLRAHLPPRQEPSRQQDVPVRPRMQPERRATAESPAAEPFIAPRPVRPQASPSPQLPARPRPEPLPGEAGAQKGRRRGPSLFERMADAALGRKAGDQREIAEAPSFSRREPGPSQRFGAHVEEEGREPRHRESDQSAQQPAVDERLEIPAFLRRQAN